MARVILIEPNSKIEQVYRLNLEVYVGLEVRVFKNVKDAIAYIQTQKFDLVISRNTVHAKLVAQLIKDELTKKNSSIPMIVYGDGEHPKDIYHSIPGALDLKSIVKKSAESLGITAQSMANKKVDNFFGIPIPYYEYIDMPTCDIYLKEPDQTYSLLFAQDHPIHKEKIQEFLSDAVPALYIERDQRLKIVSQITAEMMALLEHEELDPNEQIQALESNIELVNRKLLKLGINEETIRQIDKNIENLQKVAKQNPKLSVLLSRLLNNQSSFMYLHTQMMTYVACHILQNIDWGNKEQEDKVCFISYFHDIALENDVQAKIHSNDELKLSRLSSREKTLVEKHAQISAEIISKYPHAPMGADQIIKQHHGSLNGLGFLDNFSAQLSPMAMVIIVAEEFTHQLLAQDDTMLDKAKIIVHIKNKFKSTRFKKIIDLVDSILI